MEDLPKRKISTALWRGAWGYCPQCNEGRLFSAYLKTHEHCSHCDLHLAGHKADDAPPYFTMFIVGHIIVPLAVVIEHAYVPPIYIHVIFFSVLTIVLSLIILPIVKGAVIAMQWALRMHGFAASPTDAHKSETDI